MSRKQPLLISRNQKMRGVRKSQETHSFADDNYTFNYTVTALKNATSLLLCNLVAEHSNLVLIKHFEALLSQHRTDGLERLR